MSFLENLSKSAMILPYSQGKISTEVKTKRGAAAVQSALRLGDNVPSGATVGALGAMTGLAKELVNRPLGANRTYMYGHTLSYERGSRLVMVTRVPDVLAALQENNRAVQAGLAEFMPQYEAYFNSTNGKADMGDSQIVLPTPDKVRASAYIRVGVPQPIQPCDLAGLSLPAGLAADIAERTNAKHAAAAEAAKDAAMRELIKELDKVSQQLTNGKRIHQSILDNARLASRNLREFTEGYDNDPRVLAIAEVVDQRIASIPNIEQVKNSVTLREQAVRAAEAGSKALTDVVKSKSTATPVPAAPAASNVIVGDSLLADLID